MSKLTQKINEAELIAELDDITTFVECIVNAVDNKTHSTLIITPLVYSRHVAVLYTVIDCMKRIVKDEAARTGQIKPHVALENWCNQNGVW